MEKEDLLALAIQCLEDITVASQRLTSGNVSHLGRNIQSAAGSMAEYLQKHKEEQNHENNSKNIR